MDVAFAGAIVVCAVLCIAAWLALRPAEGAPPHPDALPVPLVSGGIPFFGHALSYAADPRGFLEACKSKHGVPFEISLIGTRYVVVDGSLRRPYFQAPDEFLSMDKALVVAIAAEHTVGVSSIEHPYHVPIIRREFSLARLGKYISSLPGNVAPELDAALGSAKDQGRPVELADVAPLAWRCIATCSANSMFGPRLGRLPELLEIMTTFHSDCAAVIQARQIVPRFLLGFAARRAAADRDAMRTIIRREIGLRKGSVASETTDAGAGMDCLTQLLAERDEKGRLLSEEAVTDRIMTLIFASMVTTAGTLHHALCDLAGYGHTLVSQGSAWVPLSVALRNEAAAAWAAAGDAGISVATLEAMPLLHSFVVESTRLASLPLSHMRKAMRAGQLGKWAVPAGAIVAMSSSLTSSDAAVFPEPGVFDARRFIDSPVTEPAHDVAGMFAFGTGRHVCPGRHFAFAEVKVAIAELLLRGDIRTVSGRPPAYASDSVFLGRAAERVVFTPQPQPLL